MTNRSSRCMAGVLVAVVLAFSPSTGEAQYGYSCVDNTQCPAGSLCMNGSCVQQGYQQPQQPVYGQPAYGQPAYGQPAYGQPAYPQPQPQPPREPRTVTRPNLGLIISGAALLGGFWAANIFAGMFACVGCDSFTHDQWDSFRYSSLVPVVGPFIQLGVKPTPFSNDDWGIWLVLDGVLQTGGLVLLILGIASPVTHTVYADAGTGFELAVSPVVGPSTNGLGLSGRF